VPEPCPIASGSRHASSVCAPMRGGDLSWLLARSVPC
jgi:hypothetical protein